MPLNKYVYFKTKIIYVNKYLWNNLYTLNNVDIKFSADDIGNEKKL